VSEPSREPVAKLVGVPLRENLTLGEAQLAAVALGALKDAPLTAATTLRSIASWAPDEVVIEVTARAGRRRNRSSRDGERPRDSELRT
jgi:hypothetical protein